MADQKAKELIEKYQMGGLSQEEENLLEGWVVRGTVREMDLTEQELEEDLLDIRNHLPLYTEPEKKKLWLQIAAAAAVLLCLAIGVNNFVNKWRTAHHPALLANKIKPGGNKAYLTLASGKRLSLTDAANGELAKEAGVEISKSTDGQLIYQVMAPASAQDGTFTNTIETPRGGQYQVRLPDGSKVWLNAASKLSYPVSFSGRAERKVELSGEAYFEVAKDQQHPFRVKTTGQQVEVLGTHFNLSAYQDDPDTKTTLLEGSVRVLIGALSGKPAPLMGRPATSPPDLKEGWLKTGVVLKPNQQSILNQNAQIKLAETVNLEEVLSWKNSKFYFENENMSSITRKIARWYDVDFIYQTSPKEIAMTGMISKQASITEVLSLLESVSQLHFKIEGRKITIIK